MRCGSCRAATERRRKGEYVHFAPNCMSCMGMAAGMGVELDIFLLSPHRHASGHRLTRQWTISFITKEKLFPRLAQQRDSNSFSMSSLMRVVQGLLIPLASRPDAPDNRCQIRRSQRLGQLWCRHSCSSGIGLRGTPVTAVAGSDVYR